MESDQHGPQVIDDVEMYLALHNAVLRPGNSTSAQGSSSSSEVDSVELDTAADAWLSLGRVRCLNNFLMLTRI